MKINIKLNVKVNIKMNVEINIKLNILPAKFRYWKLYVHRLHSAGIAQWMHVV